jgi:hypothetical protein
MRSLGKENELHARICTINPGQSPLYENLWNGAFSSNDEYEHYFRPNSGFTLPLSRALRYYVKAREKVENQQNAPQPISRTWEAGTNYMYLHSLSPYLPFRFFGTTASLSITSIH